MAKSKSRTTSKSKAKSAPKPEAKPEAEPAVKAAAPATSEPTAKPEAAAKAARVAAPPPAAPKAKPAPAGKRRIVWLHVSTVISATILIGAEVFGAAFAGSWALATLFGFGFLGARILDILLMLCGVAIMVQFVRSAHLIEPFTVRE